MSVVTLPFESLGRLTIEYCAARQIACRRSRPTLGRERGWGKAFRATRRVGSGGAIPARGGKVTLAIVA